MPNDFVEKMAKYVAFLHREQDMWMLETDWTEAAKVFGLKIEACCDICTMFGVREEVWNKAKEIYDWESEDEK